MGLFMFLERLGQIKKEVEKRLELFLDLQIVEAAEASQGAEQLLQVLKEFTLRGGKRLRAALVVYGYRCFSSQATEAVWNVAMSVELLQSFLLIHDDVIDEDDVRRGGWTVHRWYHDLHLSNTTRRNPRQFGESMAILCGDIAYVLANEIVGGIAVEAPLKGQVVVAMNRMIRQVIYGECMDVLCEEQGATEADIFTICRLKSAVYTVEGPLHLGAILGGATEDDFKQFSRYALPLGEAFQIQDDILGLFGDAEKIGKPVGSDIREGKRTFLILKALDEATPSQKVFLEKMLGNRDVEIADVEKVREIIVDTGALKYSKDLAKKLVQESHQALVDCRWREEGKRFLEQAIEFMVQREY